MIYYFGIYNNNGGLENFAKNLILKVTSLNKEVKYTLLVTDKVFSYRQQFLDCGCKIIVLPNPHKTPLKFYKSLLKIFQKFERGDLLQANICSYRNPLLFMAIKRAKIKSLIVGHYTKVDDGKLSFLHYWNKQLFKKVGKHITNSEEVTNFMFPKGDEPIFISNGVDLDRFAYNKVFRDEIRKSLNVQNEFVIGQIGRISHEKNQLFSLRLLSDLLKCGYKVKLVLVGKEMENDSRAFAVEHCLLDSVIFVGPVYNGIEKYYSAFDICLLPSLNEGMSLSLLECCANGVKSIFSNAVPELGIKVDSVTYLPLEIDRWRQKIISLMSENEDCRRNSLKGTVYDLDECAKNYILEYNRVINE